MRLIEHEAGGVPRWLELSGLVGALGLAVVGVVGLVLAVAGRYDPWMTLAVAFPMVALASVWLARALPARACSRSATAAAIVAVAVAVAFAGFAASTPSQNVLVDRDPGSYTNTARGLVDDGSLRVDARSRAFAGVSGLSFASQAVFDVGPAEPIIAGGPREPSGRLEFQFNHMTSVVLATGYAIGGRALMFRLPALAMLIGLLLIYAVAVRACRRPWVALLAPAALGVAAPILYVARNTYSEPFTLVPLWAAVLALTHFHRQPWAGFAVIGGMLLGATVSVRVDAILYVALAVPLAGASIATAHGDVARARRRGWTLAALAALLPTVVGTYDLYRRAGGYASDRSSQ